MEYGIYHKQESEKADGGCDFNSSHTEYVGLEVGFGGAGAAHQYKANNYGYYSHEEQYVVAFSESEFSLIHCSSSFMFI